MNAKRKERGLWGGFCGGKLFVMEVDTGFGGFGEGRTRMPALFASRREARRQFQDVRCVSVQEAKGDGL